MRTRPPYTHLNSKIIHLQAKNGRYTTPSLYWVTTAVRFSVARLPGHGTDLHGQRRDTTMDRLCGAAFLEAVVPRVPLTSRQRIVPPHLTSLALRFWA